jgi:Membrane domain of glycerophosphoryl diester phosphodiesterase
VVTILRPLSTSELLDRTFHLYRNNFLMFVGIAALPQLAVLALHLVDAAFWLRFVIAGRGLRTLFFVVATFVAVEISHAATITAVSSLHLSGATGIASAYSSAKSSLLRVVGIASFAVWVPLMIAVVLGAIAVSVSAGILAGTGMFSDVGGAAWIRAAIFVIVFMAAPLFALRWWLAWSLVVPVTVIEGGGLRTSMRRSRSLTKGRRGRIFVIYLLVALLTWVVAILFQTPFYSMISWKQFFRPSHAGSLALTVSAVGNFLSTCFVGPLLTIAFTLIYYDERVRREGFDLQLMMSTLESQAQNAAPALAS